MAEKTLDKSKDYGTILGGGSARYEQGGLQFDVAGKLCKKPKNGAADKADLDKDFPDLPGSNTQDAGNTGSDNQSSEDDKDFPDLPGGGMRNPLNAGSDSAVDDTNPENENATEGDSEQTGDETSESTASDPVTSALDSQLVANGVKP